MDGRCKLGITAPPPRGRSGSLQFVKATFTQVRGCQRDRKRTCPRDPKRGGPRARRHHKSQQRKQQKHQRQKQTRAKADTCRAAARAFRSNAGAGLTLPSWGPFLRKWPKKSPGGLLGFSKVFFAPQAPPRASRSEFMLIFVVIWADFVP